VTSSIDSRSSSPDRVTLAGMSVAEWCVRLDLAACYRLCAINGWHDLIYTHISAAVPGEHGHFLINPFGYRFDEVTATNLVKIDLEGRVIGDQRQKVNVSGFAIHGAVHAARLDAACVMHLHNPNGVAVGMQQDGLLPLSQHALRFYGQMAYHDYEGLALSPQEQSRLIGHLGDKPAMLLRNHGTLVIGRTVAEAFVLMDTLDKACLYQLKAQAGQGRLNLIPDDICSKTHRELTAGGAIEGELEWPALLRKLEQIVPSYRS
jgi:ribulose-5-phosphate 4-epimerase/fuculose-1-phosphate aldolase